MAKLELQKISEQADQLADDELQMPGEHHPDWHDVRDRCFAALVLEAAALECDEIRHPWGYSSETPDWIQGTDHCATAIRAMKPGKEQT